MDDLDEFFQGRSPHPPGRGIRCGTIGELLLKSHQFPEEQVVFGVGDLRSVLNVIKPVVAFDLPAEFRHAGGRLLSVHMLDTFLNSRV